MQINFFGSVSSRCWKNIKYFDSYLILQNLTNKTVIIYFKSLNSIDCCRKYKVLLNLFKKYLDCHWVFLLVLCQLSYTVDLYQGLHFQDDKYQELKYLKITIIFCNLFNDLDRLIDFKKNYI